MPERSEPWVGRPLQRFEDDALLRGEGRFLDDLSPVAHSYHAAVVRSQLAHARIAVDASAALEAPGVIGVLTGADVVALSRPFPAGIDSGTPQYATAVDTVRYVGEPIAVVVARDRYVAEDGRSSSTSTTTRSTPCSTRSPQRRTPCTSGCSSTETLTQPWQRPSSFSARRSTSLASPARRLSATRSSPTGMRRPVGSRPGRISRDRSRSTASLRPRSGSRATACDFSRPPTRADRSGSSRRCSPTSC